MATKTSTRKQTDRYFDLVHSQANSEAEFLLAA
jgi:hypothetical protein